MSTIDINGVTTQVPAGAIAYKYADPTEDARWVYEESDMDDIRHEDPSLIIEVVQQSREFSASQFAQNAGWDFSCIEATAAKGVSETDVETIEAMGFGPAEVAELLAHCQALVAEQSKQ